MSDPIVIIGAIGALFCCAIYAWLIWRNVRLLARSQT
jgi:cell division protein FtsW (lipid II flippase)